MVGQPGQVLAPKGSPRADRPSFSSGDINLSTVTRVQDVRGESSSELQATAAVGLPMI